MRTVTTAVAAILVAACSTTATQPQEIEATRDFVAAAELEEVSEIRLDRGLSYVYVNNRFVIIPTRRGDYLAEFGRDCFELRQSFDQRTMGQIDANSPMTDTRRDNKLRTGTDTIRGCHIAKIYEITEAQREELKDLGDAPGDEIYMPDEEN